MRALAQRDLGEPGCRFQFITLAGFHVLNLSIHELACGYRSTGMTGYVALHEREVGAGLFDLIAEVVSEGRSSTLALRGSTEEHQFGNGP